MCLYPLHLISYDSEQNKSLYENSLVQIEELGQGFWAGFSFAMAAQIYAMAYKGNGAYERLRQFAHGFVAENGFHLNGDFKGYGYSALHYRPFTLESLFGYCDALQEMLLQEHRGFIHLFPALPDEWKDKRIAFERLRSYGGVEVSAEWRDGKPQTLVLRSKKPQTVRVYNNFGKEELCFSDGQKVRCAIGESFGLFVEGEISLV